MSRARRNTTIAGLTDAKRMQLFRAVEQVIRDDPTLSKVVKTWRSFEGHPDDWTPPTPDQCPWVRLKYLAAANRPAGSVRSMIPIVIQVEVAVAGSLQNDIVNLWEAIEDSLFTFKPYRGTTVKDFLRKAFSGYQDLIPPGTNIDPGAHGGMYEYHFEEPPFFPAGGSNPNAPNAPVEPTMLAGVGRFVGSAFKPA